MNTAEKGRRYEWALKRELEGDPGTLFVLRMAGSHGPFDLVHVLDTGATFWIQAKTDSSCGRARREVGRLRTAYAVLPYVAYVHRTPGKEYCWH